MRKVTMIIDIKDNFIQPDWPAPAHIKAYTSLRQSGVGLPQFESSPKAPKPGNLDRALLKTLLALPSDPIWVNQTHSTIALPAQPENDGKEADAVYSIESNRICAVLTADCLPVLICNKQGTQVAAIHAGWRGLANGVIEATLQKMDMPPSETLIWFGPAIGPTRFLVRKDVYDIFTQKNPEAAQGFRSVSEEQWLGDLYTLARLRLANLNLTQIYGGNYCTYSDQERFFSYRRDAGTPGRIVSLIWIAAH